MDPLPKLFVGGLSWETTVEKLTEYFCRFGEVIDAAVMKNPETGRSRGFGFVTFKDPTCVHLVLSSGPHQLDGRTIDPKSCNAKGAQKNKKEAKMMNFPKIFLGGLPPNINETLLREFFSKYGKVIEVVIMYDQEKKKSRGNGFRGFGFLSFESEESVNSVVSEHFVTINGKKVEVKRAEPRDKTQPPSQVTQTMMMMNNGSSVGVVSVNNGLSTTHHHPMVHGSSGSTTANSSGTDGSSSSGGVLNVYQTGSNGSVTPVTLNPLSPPNGSIPIGPWWHPTPAAGVPHAMLTPSGVPGANWITAAAGTTGHTLVPTYAGIPWAPHAAHFAAGHPAASGVASYHPMWAPAVGFAPAGFASAATHGWPQEPSNFGPARIAYAAAAGFHPHHFLIPANNTHGTDVNSTSVPSASASNHNITSENNNSNSDNNTTITTAQNNPIPANNPGAAAVMSAIMMSRVGVPPTGLSSISASTSASSNSTLFHPYRRI